MTSPSTCSAQNPIRIVLSLLTLTLLALTFAPVAALSHRGQGSAVPSNSGGDPKKSHPGWSDDYCTLSPDRIIWIYDFRHACVHHDGCYSGFPDKPGTLGKYWVSKDQCDQWFFYDMQASCADQHPSRNGRRYDLCMTASRDYLLGVQEHGSGYKHPGGKAPPAPKPAPQPTPAPTPQPTLAPTPQPTLAPTPLRRTIDVFNKLTNGSSGYREDTTAARLTTRPWKNCGSRDCNVNGTERTTGGTYYPAVCWTTGDVTTNGENGSASDDAFQYTSDRYYGVTHEGATRYVSWVWIHPNHRGGLGLSRCG